MPEAVLVFTVVSDEAEWELSDVQIAQWQALYPELDVLRECRRAWAWIDANPRRRKRARGMKHFLVGWLNRATPMRTDPEHPDIYGHFPRCTSWKECTAKALAEAKAAKV